MNGTLKTFILMAALTALFGWVGLMMAGKQGMIIALLMAIGMNFWSYYNSDKAVLQYYNAEDVPESHELHQITSELTRRAAMPMPRVCIINNPQPNAFATGRDPAHAAVCATTGLLQKLSPAELRGVIAHELAHIKNRDTLTMTVTASIAGAISMLGNFMMFFGGGSRDSEHRPHPLIQVLVMLLAPMAAAIVQMAISRAREFEADRIGSEISGDPRSLATALATIAGNAEMIDNIEAEQNPTTAHMFIINPLHMKAASGLFSTHPNTEDRIRRLLAMDKNPETQHHVQSTITDAQNATFKPESDPFAPNPDDFNPWT